jgi:hypothetical protein
LRRQLQHRLDQLELRREEEEERRVWDREVDSVGWVYQSGWGDVSTSDEPNVDSGEESSEQGSDY